MNFFFAVSYAFRRRTVPLGSWENSDSPGRVSKGQVDSPVLEIQVKPKLPITRHTLAG